MRCSKKRNPMSSISSPHPCCGGSNERIRYPLMKQASDAGVPAAIVEKPIAVESEDWKQISGLSKETKTKFVVNTQLNFHPQNLELKADVAAGRIGEIKFIDASARSTPVDQGPHVLQLVSSYIDNSRPVRVLGQISGAEHLDSAQPLSTICKCARPVRERTSRLRRVWYSHRTACIRRSGCFLP